jgi:hypothetical protein
MRKFAVGILLASAAVLVSSAFASVKEKVEAAKTSGKPVVFAVDKGEYTCTSCSPEVKVKANGAAQKVTGHTEYNQIAVAARSPTLIEVVEDLNGKHQAYYNYSVSADGKTLTVKWTDYSGPKIEKGGYVAKRVGAAPAGAHAASGSWQIEETMAETSSNK